MDLAYGATASLIFSFFVLFQMQISENSQPFWVEFTPTPNQSTNKAAAKSSVILITSGVVSHDGM